MILRLVEETIILMHFNLHFQVPTVGDDGYVLNLVYINNNDSD